MKATLEQVEFQLTKKQIQAIGLISSGAMHIMLYGGSRSAKTFTLIRSIIYRALIAPNSRHLIARFRFNHIKSSVVYDTFPKVMQLCFPDLEYNLNKSDWFVELPNGSQIWFTGLDDKERTEKILGNEYATIFLNECSQLSYHTRNLLRTRLAQKCPYIKAGEIKYLRLKMFYDENPPAKGHWTYKLFIEKREPLERLALKNPDNYISLLMNPVDNQENLLDDYLEEFSNYPKRMRDRFYLGLFADETENALWNNTILDKSRVDKIPEGVEIIRVVIAVDPSGASDNPEENNDDIGIGVVYLGSDKIAYVMEDLTLQASPARWGEVVSNAFKKHNADRVVAEMNYGGAMVEHVIKSANPNIPYRAVVASRGKMVRAEPVSALHETGKIKLVGRFDELEDELLSSTTNGYTGSRSPNRLDWFVWAIHELFPGLTQPIRIDRPVPPIAGHQYLGNKKPGYAPGEEARYNEEMVTYNQKRKAAGLPAEEEETEPEKGGAIDRMMFRALNQENYYCDNKSRR